MKKAKQKCGVVGVGAFGAFMLKYLIPYFDVLVTDKFKDLSDVESIYNVSVTDLRTVAACDIVILAVPVAEMEDTIKNILPYLHKGQLVIDLQRHFGETPAATSVPPTIVLR